MMFIQLKVTDMEVSISDDDWKNATATVLNIIRLIQCGPCEHGDIFDLPLPTGNKDKN